MRKAILILAFLISTANISASTVQLKQTETVTGLTVELYYRALQPGEVIQVLLKESSSVREATARFLGKKYTFFKMKNSTEYLALIGLDLGVSPGAYPLNISILYSDNSHESLAQIINVVSKEFPVKKLWVEEKFVTPPKEVQERIQRESKILQTIYDIYTPMWLGEGPFIVPSEGKIMSNFGEQRFFNNKPRSSHGGVDISTPSGSPVKASNSGRVLLAADLYFAGKTVIIDHGLGVHTMYCHFSKILVKRGEFLKKGKIIGEIGATGRVTGPHLHWGVKLYGSRVDPLSLLNLKFK
ncbi:MAG: M23 family metallopeptidase [Candidatus Aminicenantes bacterium]|nr:M23 family metallopeptidase [Candidatus Aminicenantes bacterium]